eukprot:5916130-Amphidinium_carterae.2
MGDYVEANGFVFTTSGSIRSPLPIERVLDEKTSEAPSSDRVQLARQKEMENLHRHGGGSNALPALQVKRRKGDLGRSRTVAPEFKYRLLSRCDTIHSRHKSIQDGSLLCCDQTLPSSTEVAIRVGH